MKKMKKLFTLALALLCGMGAMADDYTGHLVRCAAERPSRIRRK